MNTLNEFIVENTRTARRFLRKAGCTHNFDEVVFHVLNKHTAEIDIPGFLDYVSPDHSVGLLSEAGNPCIADPGQSVVAEAHRRGIKVIPLVGPNSILMALIASGFNGQSFTFHGYLPIETAERKEKIRQMESDAQHHDQTQIFMETPYRNNSMLSELYRNCEPSTLLCIASDITTSSEFIYTQTIKQWEKQNPDLKKKPAIFLLYTTRFSKKTT
jgi:16S rRNA (cytidine1402-2'-O)-methyltransferase